MFSKMFRIHKDTDVRQFPAGESTGFSIKVASKSQDYKTKADVWTNYEAVIFSKHPKQIEFYQSSIVAGSAVELTAEDLQIVSFTGDNGITYNTISLVNARLSGVVSMGVSAPQQNQAPQNNGGGFGEPPSQFGDQEDKRF